MNRENVITLFEKLSGLSEDEGREYLFLCDEAMEHLVSIAATTESSSGQQEMAAAARAYYRYVLLSMTDGSGAVKVGEVSVHPNKDRLFYAERLYREALAQLKGYIGEDFVFKGI